MIFFVSLIETKPGKFFSRVLAIEEFQILYFFINTLVFCFQTRSCRNSWLENLHNCHWHIQGQRRTWTHICRTKCVYYEGHCSTGNCFDHLQVKPCQVGIHDSGLARHVSKCLPDTVLFVWARGNKSPLWSIRVTEHWAKAV